MCGISKNAPVPQEAKDCFAVIKCDRKKRHRKQLLFLLKKRIWGVVASQSRKIKWECTPTSPTPAAMPLLAECEVVGRQKRTFAFDRLRVQEHARCVEPLD